MSLSSCLRKAGNLINKDDRLAIMSTAKNLRASGLDADEAGLQAITRQTEVMRAAIKAITGRDEPVRQLVAKPGADKPRGIGFDTTSASAAARSVSREKFNGNGAQVEIKEVDGGFDALINGERVGRLRDNLPRGAAEQLDENASVDIVKVDNEFKGHGVGSALYDAFNEKHGGRIAPSGKTSPEAWALWKRKFPEKVDAFVEAEAGRIRDGADPMMVVRNITDPEVARSVSEAAGDVVIRSASRQTDTPEFKAWFGDSKVVDEQGRPLVVYHGTTNDFSEFNRSRANLESDMGAGFYFSNTPDDVAANYAGEGPDLTQRIELLAERLVSNDEFDDMDEARKVARQRLSEGRPNTMPVYLSLQKPVVLGGKKETFFDYTEEYNEELDEHQEPTGRLVDFVEALRQVLYDDRLDDADAEQVVADIFQAAEGEGLEATKLIEIAKGSEGLAYAVDKEGDGSLASTEILRRAFQGAGFDGIVDNTVDAKFGSQSEGARRFNKGMKGMDVDTVHYIAFEPEQIKSATGNSGAFDPNDADITRSVARTRFNGKDVTIESHDRWSIYQERSAQLGDGMVRWVEDPDMAYVTDIQAGAKARGKAMLEWLAKDSGKALYAVGVVEDSAEFWDKMEDADLIQGQTDENFVDYFGLRRSVTRPEFFSQLERAVAAVPDRLATMAAPQWKLWLDANASKLGVKKDEISASGLVEFILSRGRGRLSRDDLLSFLESRSPLQPESSDVVVDRGNPYAKLISDPLGRDALGEKGRDFLRFFGDLLVSKGVEPPVGQSFGKGLARDAKLLRDLYSAEAGGEEGYSSFDAPTKRVVMMSVGNAINNLEVFRSVVEAVPVDVMDVLGGEQRSAKLDAGDVPVLKDGATVDAGLAVASAIDVAAQVIADVAAGERAEGAPRLWDVARKPLKGGAAGGTGAGDFWHDGPVFSRGRTASGADWDSPSASKFDDLIYKFQDKQIEARRVVEAIKEAAGAISDDLNVYLNEELYHGRAAKRTEDFVNMELNPLIEDMAKAGMTIADLEEFLHARHAKEANAVIAQRNPGEPGLQDGGSGMTNAEADNYMATLPAADRAKLEAAAAKVDAIIAGTRKMFVDYELESQATVDAWDGMFKHYVPLQREDKEGSPGLGQGFSIKGRETKGRTGSTRKVVDILANIAMQRERAIVRGEKNRVAQSLVGLVRANENPDFWLVDEVPTERVFNPNTGLVEDRVDPLYKSRDNAVVAKIKDPSGAVREHAVLFNEDDPRALRMAQALKNLDAPNLEGLLGVSAKITRYFAAISTQYNPVFGVTNLVRDVQAALINLSSTPLAGDQKKIAKYTASALAGIYGDLRKARSGQTSSSQWAQLWEEFQNVGGQTGYRDLFRTSADRAKAIQNALNPTAWMDNKLGKIFTAGGTLRVPMAEAQRGGKWLFDLLSDYNDALENGTRLAAYKAGIERGLSKEQAASIAKNLTTSFNRKGSQSTQAGALYAFFNAAIQGTARIGQTIFTMEPGKPKTMRLSPTGKKIVYGGILLGSIQALALAAAGFNDEDPPAFTRERNLIIPTGGKTYVSIPMPLGLHVIPNIGRMATEFVLSGFKDPIKRGIGMTAMFADAFNPIGNAGMSMQTLAPTALDPLVALTENKDWTGRPIARTSSNKAIPGHTLGRDTATSVSEVLSEAINTLSGGNKYVAGAFSPTPDQIDYLLGQLTGGVGREYSKTEQTLKSVVRGESLPTYKIPLVGRFVGNAKGQASEGSAFYANAERLNKIETEAKGLRADGKQEEARELLAKHPEAYLIAQANTAERQVQKLRRQKSELVKAGAPREQVKAVEEEITKVMARLNRAVEGLKKPAEATE